MAYKFHKQKNEKRLSKEPTKKSLSCMEEIGIISNVVILNYIPQPCHEFKLYLTASTIISKFLGSTQHATDASTPFIHIFRQYQKSLHIKMAQLNATNFLLQQKCTEQLNPCKNCYLNTDTQV